eukprot:gene2176-17767_t
MSRPVPPPRKKKNGTPILCEQEERSQDQTTKTNLDAEKSTLLLGDECKNEIRRQECKIDHLENSVKLSNDAQEQVISENQPKAEITEAVTAEVNKESIESFAGTNGVGVQIATTEQNSNVNNTKPVRGNPYENVSIIDRVENSSEPKVKYTSESPSRERKNRPLTNPYENVPSPFKLDHSSVENSSFDEEKEPSFDESSSNRSWQRTNIEDGDTDKQFIDEKGLGEDKEHDYINASLHLEDKNRSLVESHADVEALSTDLVDHGFVPLEDPDSNFSTDQNPMDFKHLRIDGEEKIDDALYVEVPRKGSLNSLPSNELPTQSSPRVEALSQESYYQSPTSSPKPIARRALFAEATPSDSPQKRLRRPPPQPPHLDNNFNVLRSKARPNEARSSPLSEISKPVSKELSSSVPDDNIYVVPRTESYSNSSGGDTESTKSFQSARLSDPDDFSSHVYKEPSVHSNESGGGTGYGNLSDSQEDNDRQAYNVPGHGPDDYVDPDNFRPGSISLPQGANLLGSTSESDSAGSARSSAGLNIGSELETSHSDDGYECVEKISLMKNTSHGDTLGYQSGPEYVDMSPAKDDKISSLAGEYLQPLTPPNKPPPKKVKPCRPAPPAPNRLPRRPENSPAPPPVPTLAVPDDEISKFDSLDGRYQRIQSLRREMGLPLMLKGDEFLDSESESDEELKPNEDEEKKKSSKEEFAAAVKQMMAKDPASLPKSSFSQMFDDIELIYDFDQNFLQDLENRMTDWDSHKRIGDIVRKYSYFLKMYTNYIKGYDKAMTMFQECCHKFPKFAAIVKEYERKPSFLNLKITSFMLKPIQRIPSYRLLLIDYLKHLPEESEDHKDINHGLQIVSQVANHINESMKEGDKFQTMLKLQTRIINSKEIVKPGRYLLKEGILNKLSRKEAQERMFFLLTDCLLYCEHAAVSNQYKLRQELPLAGMMLDVPESIDFNKELTIISPKRSFTVVASSKEERDEWVAAIQSAIDDVSRKIGTFTIKLEHGEKFPTSLGSPVKEIGHIAPNWVPDSRATMCCICLAKFTTYNRRHHCRACGEIVCNSCSSYEAPLPYLNFDAARVCEKCYKHLYETLLIDEEVDGNTLTEKEQKKESKLKRSKSAMSSKFKVIRKTKKIDRTIRKTLPSKLTEVTAQDQECNISGYLFIVKKKKTKKRWFVLKDNALYSYKAPSDMAANSTLAVLGYNVNVTGNFALGDYVFQLEHSGLKEPYVYKAESQASAEMWVNALKKSSQLPDV